MVFDWRLRLADAIGACRAITNQKAPVNNESTVNDPEI
jgi:hypothetical protein